MLGSEGQAWEIVRTSLSLERVGIPRFAMAARMLTRAVTTLKKDGRFVGSAIEQAARAKAACEAARLSSYNIIDQRVRGVTARPEASAARVAPVMAHRAVREFAVAHLPAALAGGHTILPPPYPHALLPPPPPGPP